MLADMTPEQALHTFARRYCMTRRQEWASRYQALADSGRRSFGGDYTPGAYDTFPRYNMLDAIRCDVEALDFDRLPPLAELSECLSLAGQTASSELTGSQNAIARDAEQEERDLFERAVRGAVMSPPMDQQPLHYQRTLQGEELEKVWRVVRATWGMQGGYWFPLAAKSHASLVAFDLDKIDQAALQHRIQLFFAERGIDRVYELREFGRENYCVQAGAADLSYGTGGEGYWTSEDGDWIVYCSHEGTITLGGSIVAVASETPLASE